mgnify:CR=1 FL=1
MKKFSTRFRADWNNEDVLSEILEAYFADEEIIKTKASLCYYLNISERGFEERKRTPVFKELLEAADLYVRCSIEQAGMLSDRSFPKFLLETQYGYTKAVQGSEEVSAPEIRISIDGRSKD